MKMAAMKAMKAMKMKSAMKMKMKMAMKVSKIAKGRGAKARVFKGSKEKTTGGLKKSDLIKSKSGKIVSKKASIRGKKIYGKYLSKWTASVSKARKALGIKGFAAVGGKSKSGQALLAKARSFYKK